MENNHNFNAYFNVKLYLTVFEDIENIKRIYSDPQQLKKYLMDKYNDTKANAPEWVDNKDVNLEPTVFDSQVIFLTDKSQLLVITIPNDDSPTKTTLAGIVLDEKIRYFELAYTKDDRTGQTFYFVSEFGPRGPFTNHVNPEMRKLVKDPTLDTPSLEEFVEGIRSMIPTFGVKTQYDSKVVIKKRTLLTLVVDFFKKLFGKR